MTKKLLLISILIQILLLSNVRSQNLTDSLIDKIDITKSEEKAALLNQIAESYLPGKPDKCMIYAERALDFAIQHNNEEQTATSHKNIGVAYYNLYQYNDALAAYDKALKIYEKLGKQKQEAALLVNIGRAQTEKNNYQDALQAYTKAITIYKELSDLGGMATVQNGLGSMAWKQGNYRVALNHYHATLQTRQKLNNQAEIAASLTNVSLAYRELLKYDSAIYYCQQALNIRQSLKNAVNIANSLHDMGNIYWAKQDWEKSLEYYFRSIKLRYETGNKSEIANSYLNIGNLYTRLENTDKAREYYQLALEIYKNSNEPRKLANTLIALGNLEYDTKNYQEALSCYSLALKYRKDIGEKRDIAASLHNIGRVYSEMNKLSGAVDFLDKARNLRKELSDINGEITTLNELGNVHDKAKNPAQAQASFEAALQLARQANNLYYSSLCSRKLAEGYLHQGKTDKAFPLLQTALEDGKKLNHPELQKKAYLAISEYYKSNKDFEKALENYQQFTEIDNSQKNIQNTLKMMSIHQNLELEKKNNEIKNIESEITLLRQKEDLQTLRLNQQKYLLVFLVVIVLLAGVSIVMFYNRYQIKKKHGLILEQQYALIEDTNTQLRKSQEELTVLNATKDKYFAVIAHDIKNPLSSLLNLSQLIIEKSNTMDPAKLMEFNKMIHQSAENLYNLLENLLFWARNNTQKIRFNPLPMTLAPIGNNVVLLNKLTAHNKNITIKNEITDDIEVYADLQMLTSIMRNLVSNALKYTPEGGEVTIKAKDKYHTIEISVTDTGVGIEPADLEKLFKLDTHFTTQGTYNEAGTGLGLILCKEFVEKNKGKISVFSEPGKGSTFTFTLPSGKN